MDRRLLVFSPFSCAEGFGLLLGETIVRSGEVLGVDDEDGDREERWLFILAKAPPRRKEPEDESGVERANEAGLWLLSSLSEWYGLPGG